MQDLLRPQFQSTWILVCSVQLCHQLALSKVKVCIIFSDFGKMQNVCNLLIEKLGTSVTINPPRFYHTPEAIDTLRLWLRSWGKVMCLNISAITKPATLKTKGSAGALVRQLNLLVIVLLLPPLSRQVCVTAVGNTRRKAQEVCQLFGQALGKPLLIKEEETKEWGGHMDSHLLLSADSQTLQERIQNATAYASCRVFAVFEIKGKENRRSKLP
ncbi:interleukin-1 receptor-associated kinase 1-binding protein 1 isoform 3-T4 [Geothlypis trichas]